MINILGSRRVQRLLFFVAATVTLFYLMTLLFPEKKDEISPLVFSGRPPTRFLAPGRRKNLRLENVKGFFLQDLSETKEDNFNVFQTRDFGLIQQEYSIDITNRLPPNATQWDHFRAEILRLDREKFTKRLGVLGYKVLYLFRPSESWHHRGESYYGKESWDCLWTRQDGNGTAQWIDAELTPTGIEGAKYLHKAWNKHLGNTNLAVPELFLSSPLSRAADTLIHSFNLTFRNPRPPSPVFVEFLRESFGVDTHNSRRSYTTLKKKYPLFEFEEEFSEFDPLWTSYRDETDSSVLHRAKIFLENLFLRRSEMFIAVATHESVIKAILEAIGHRQFSIPVGHMIPVVIKGSWFLTGEPRTEVERYKMFYKKNRNCTELDPVTDPDAEPEVDMDEFD
ncbi:hypothetical protein TWF225_009513 [Orbilia oligospora]|uniref:Uncharacterized protein n=1 Tax=Orbilia oligospora TaxID=2813651 RepID=A0A7C8PAL5_ORBOL|nr:hypothetical protein TWF751_011400 [Orbilia oligospora]KAF3174434.1 hypothetical protein TWF225_009513 [Orbilia oligospora]KAF3247747.1 hypothetical protein TWF217_009545 [Orbilia oligospora]KAF3258768.1 hypothetical protein TWF128_004566 [Orbilia oligospora]KAF3292745.1 hypothetical protein TWF132_005444 [Orbilia oligospora]